MTQRFERFFRQDFWMKVLALALSILLWAMVVQDYNKEATVTFDVALEVIAHPDYEVFEGRLDRETMVQVQVTGPNLVVTNIAENEIRAWVDYSRVTEPGKVQEIEVQVSGPSRIKDEVRYRVTPHAVSVTLVQNKSLNVPTAVVPAEGVVALGGREFRFTAAPLDKIIEISGRSDALDYVRRAEFILVSTDLNPPLENGTLTESTVRIRKAVTPVDATDKKVEKLKEQFGEVLLTWEELPPGKEVQVRPRTRGSLPAGYELGSVTANPATITLRSSTLNGQPPGVTEVETEPVDLDGQTKSFTTAARVIAPEGSSVAQTSVNVVVTVVESTVERVFGALPVALRGQPAGTEVTLTVPTVQVRLSGPFTQMQTLDASAVQVYLDLEGLTEGRHSLPVKIAYPPGIPEVAVDPAIIDVTISPSR